MTTSCIYPGTISDPMVNPVDLCTGAVNHNNTTTTNNNNNNTNNNNNNNNNNNAGFDSRWVCNIFYGDNIFLNDDNVFCIDIIYLLWQYYMMIIYIYYDKIFVYDDNIYLLW